jgi:hypothetical protein
MAVVTRLARSCLARRPECLPIYCLEAGIEAVTTRHDPWCFASFALTKSSCHGKDHPGNSAANSSRSFKFQPYFQSGFPYDHDQWISQAGTAMATIGLFVEQNR